MWYQVDITVSLVTAPSSTESSLLFCTINSCSDCVCVCVCTCMHLSTCVCLCVYVCERKRDSLALNQWGNSRSPTGAKGSPCLWCHCLCACSWDTTLCVCVCASVYFFFPLPLFCDITTLCGFTMVTSRSAALLLFFFFSPCYGKEVAAKVNDVITWPQKEMFLNVLLSSKYES